MEGGFASWVAAVGTLAAALATAYAAYQARVTVQDSARVARANLFLELVEKYDDIFSSISREASTMTDTGAAGITIHLLAHPADEKYIINLFRLFEREHYLQETGLVDNELWTIWSQTMKKYYSLPLFQYVFERNDEDFRRNFVDWLRTNRKV